MNYPTMRMIAVGIALAATLATAPAAAHHGRDFLLSQTAEMPDSGSLFLVPRQDYVDSGEAETEFEPALLFGASRRLALELHAHLGQKRGGDFEYESIAPTVHFLLTPPDLPWGISLFAEYEFARDRQDEVHDDDELVHHEAHLVVIPAPEPEVHGHTEGDRAELRVAFSRRRDRWLVALNLLAGEVQAPGSDLEWGYSAGLRGPLREALDWGLEVQGDLEQRSTHEALLALYYDPSRRWTVNAGLGTGFGDRAPDFTLRTAVVWRLR